MGDVVDFGAHAALFVGAAVVLNGTGLIDAVTAAAVAALGIEIWWAVRHG